MNGSMVPTSSFGWEGAGGGSRGARCDLEPLAHYNIWVCQVKSSVKSTQDLLEMKNFSLTLPKFKIRSQNNTGELSFSSKPLNVKACP